MKAVASVWIKYKYWYYYAIIDWFSWQKVALFSSKTRNFFFHSSSSYSVDFSKWRISYCPDATGLYSFENVQLSSLRAYWCDIEWEKMTRQFSERERCVYKIDFPIAFQFSTHKRQNVWTRFSNWISIMDFFVEIQWPFIPIWS